MLLPSDHFRLQHEGEAEGVAADPVFLGEIGAAALGSDAGQLVVQAQNCAAAGHQLIIVPFALQLLLRIDRGVEGESLPGIAGRGGQRNACAFDRDIVAVVMAPVLLRPDVVLLQIRNRGPEDAVVSRVVLIDIGLAGTHAKIGDLPHGCRQEQAETDPGKSGDLRVFGGVHIQADPAVRINSDCIIHPQDRLNGHGAD